MQIVFSRHPSFHFPPKPKRVPLAVPSLHDAAHQHVSLAPARPSFRPPDKYKGLAHMRALRSAVQKVSVMNCSSRNGARLSWQLADRERAR